MGGGLCKDARAQKEQTARQLLRDENNALQSTVDTLQALILKEHVPPPFLSPSPPHDPHPPIWCGQSTRTPKSHAQIVHQLQLYLFKHA